MGRGVGEECERHQTACPESNERSEKLSPPGGDIVHCSLVEGLPLLRGCTQPLAPVQSHLDIPGRKAIVIRSFSLSLSHTHTHPACCIGWAVETSW